MKTKHWLGLCTLMVGLLSTATFAGYDTRGYGYAPVGEYGSPAYYNRVHDQCIAESRERYREDSYGFRRHYLNCEHRYLYMHGESNYYPEQPSHQPSP